MAPQRPPANALQADIASFRRFNRMYTKFLGTLNEGLLQTQFSLAEARVLYELASRPSPTATGIAQQLELDPGYLSRILARFERAALLRRTVSAQDGRSTELRLTASGRAAFRKLDLRSDKQAVAVFEELTTAARLELIRYMSAIEAILTPAEPGLRRFELRPPRVGDMGWVIRSEGLGYAEQFGWDQSFEALVAKIVSEFMAHFDPHWESCWIAERDGRNVGHVFLVRHPENSSVAKLRLLFVDPSARGQGLGHTLVAACIDFARAAGYSKVVLWTQSMLTAAHTIYTRAGFCLVKEEPHHSFGHDLIGQDWELELV